MIYNVSIDAVYGISLFVDDGAIWHIGKIIDFLIKQIQTALNKIGQWANAGF